MMASIMSGTSRAQITSFALAGAIATLGLTLLALASAQDFASLGTLIAAFGLFLGLAIVVWSGCGRHIAGPFFILSASHALMFIARPLYAMAFQSGENIFANGGRYAEQFAVAQLIAAAGFVALSLGMVIGSGSGARGIIAARNDLKIASPVRGVPDRQWKILAPLLWLVVVVGLLLYGSYVFSVGPTRFFAVIGSGRSESYYEAVRGVSAYQSSGVYFAMGALYLIGSQYLVMRRRLAVAAVLTLVILLSIPQVFAGSRSGFIPVLIALVLIIQRLFPGGLRLRRWWPAVPILFVVGLVAPRIWRDGLARGGSITEAIQSALSPREMFGGFFGGLDTAMVDAFEVQVAAQHAGKLDLQLGATYLASLTAAVPRSIWPDKPGTVDQILNEQLFPVTAARQIGFAFGVYSEPYFNFGIAGVISVCLLFGAVLARLWVTSRSSKSITMLVVAAFAVGFAAVIMRGNLTFDSQRFFILMGPAVVAVLLSRLMVGKEAGPAHRPKLRPVGREGADA